MNTQPLQSKSPAPCQCRAGQCEDNCWAFCVRRKPTPTNEGQGGKSVPLQVGRITGEPLAGLSAEHIAACRRAAMLDLQLALAKRTQPFRASRGDEGEC